MPDACLKQPRQGQFLVQEGDKRLQQVGRLLATLARWRDRRISKIQRENKVFIGRQPASQRLFEEALPEHNRSESLLLPGLSLAQALLSFHEQSDQRAPQALPDPPLSAGADFVEGLFLHGVRVHPQLHHDEGKPHLPSDLLGHQRRVPQAVDRGENRVSVDRRHHAAVAIGRVDSPSGSPRGGVLPDQGRPLAELGSRTTSVRAPPTGRGLQHERGKLDVAECVGLLPPLQQDVPPGAVRQETGPLWRICQEIRERTEKIPHQVHLRPVESPFGSSEASLLRDW